MKPDRSGIHAAVRYTSEERERDDAAWDQLLRGPVKVRQPSADDLSKLEAKRDAADFVALLGLSIREVARLVGRSEAEVRHWLDERRLDREVPASFYSRLYRALGPRAVVAWRSIHAAWIRDDLIQRTGS